MFGAVVSLGIRVASKLHKELPVHREQYRRYDQERGPSWRSSFVLQAVSWKKSSSNVLTWNQVFCELDRQSRVGQVQPTAKGPGIYAMSNLAASNSSI